jgi:transposase
MPCKQYHPLEVRAQVLTLWAIGWTLAKISRALDISKRTVGDMIKRGKDRGYNPNQTGSLRLEARYIEDSKRSGLDLLGPTHKPAPNPTQPAKKWVGSEK